VLARVNGRPDEGSAPHRLEAIALIVYRCGEAAVLHPTVPSEQSGLRYPEFIDSLVNAYDSRFFPKTDRVDQGPDVSGGV
jgi:hypothetical protein